MLSVKCRMEELKKKKKKYSELNIFILSGSVFQVEDPEKAKLVLNRSIRGRGKTVM